MNPPPPPHYCLRHQCNLSSYSGNPFWKKICHLWRYMSIKSVTEENILLLNNIDIYNYTAVSAVLHYNVFFSNLYSSTVSCTVYTDAHCCTPRSIEDSVVQYSAAPILYSVHRTLLFVRGLLRTPPLSHFPSLWRPPPRILSQAITVQANATFKPTLEWSDTSGATLGWIVPGSAKYKAVKCL